MTPHRVLGVARHATTVEIKRAYAALVKQNRPDDDPVRFQQIQQAFEACLAMARTAPRVHTRSPRVPVTADAAAGGDEPDVVPEDVEFAIHADASLDEQTVAPAAPRTDESRAPLPPARPPIVPMAQDRRDAANERPVLAWDETTIGTGDYAFDEGGDERFDEEFDEENDGNFDEDDADRRDAHGPGGDVRGDGTPVTAPPPRTAAGTTAARPPPLREAPFDFERFFSSLLATANSVPSADFERWLHEHPELYSIERKHALVAPLLARLWNAPPLPGPWLRALLRFFDLEAVGGDPGRQLAVERLLQRTAKAHPEWGDLAFNGGRTEATRQSAGGDGVPWGYLLWGMFVLVQLGRCAGGG